MKEIRDIVAAYELAAAAGQAAALATVINVEGSSYRQAGARMLIREDGCMTGAISGGCLEGDALRKAKLVMDRGLPKLVRYDTNDDDDAQLGLGLGCQGIIDVLIEPLHPGSAGNAINVLKLALGERRPQVLVTHAARTPGAASAGTCFLLSAAAGQMPGESPGRFLTQAESALRSETSMLLQTDADLTFFELLQPELRLLVCGAGNDAVPLVKMAAVLGWEAHVVDGRPSYATAARFAAASSVSLVKADDGVLHPAPDSRTAAVLMSHNYNYDIAMLRRLLPLGLPYIGMLGPKRKLERMLLECGLDPDTPPRAVYGPTGLDIGASTPEEIALSIVAEIQSVMRQRSGNPLRERVKPIHAQ